MLVSLHVIHWTIAKVHEVKSLDVIVLSQPYRSLDQNYILRCQ